MSRRGLIGKNQSKSSGVEKGAATRADLALLSGQALDDPGCIGDFGGAQFQRVTRTRRPLFRGRLLRKGGRGRKADPSGKGNDDQPTFRSFDHDDLLRSIGRHEPLPGNRLQSRDAFRDASHTVVSEKRCHERKGRGWKLGTKRAPATQPNRWQPRQIAACTDQVFRL